MLVEQNGVVLPVCSTNQLSLTQPLSSTTQGENLKSQTLYWVVFSGKVWVFPG